VPLLPTGPTPFDRGGGNPNPVLANLFKSLDTQNLTSNNYIRKGNLISFSYAQWIHDPYPLIIVTDVLPNNRIRGVNLHYLTFPYIRNLLKMGANNLSFSYANIRGNKYIVDAFRSYKWHGVRQIKVMDSAFLLSVMASVRSFDPSQVRAIRRAVQDQINREVNPKAQATPTAGATPNAPRIPPPTGPSVGPLTNTPAPAAPAGGTIGPGPVEM